MIRCPDFKGLREGARPAEHSFQLCAESSLGDLGKVSRGHFMGQEEEDLNLGGVWDEPACPSVSS